MAKLTLYRQMAVRASTLVEVLIALIILLSVFAAGMLLFTRLVNASTSNRQITVQMELKQLRAAYLAGDVDIRETRTTQVATYGIEEVTMEAYADRKRVLFYAYDNENRNVIDSLILILPRDEDQDTL